MVHHISFIIHYTLETDFAEPQATATAGHASTGGFRAPQQTTGVTFDRFVRCCVVVKTLTESFQKLDTDRDGWIQINYDQFMHTVLSAP